MRRSLKLLLVVVAALAPDSARAEPEPELDRGELIRKLQAKGAPFYAGFKGVASRRRVTSEERDPRTNKLEKTRTMQVTVSEYFYEPLVRKVLWCKVEGKTAAIKECEGRKGRKPAWPVFDAQGPKNYQVKWVGQKMVRRVPCHKLKIIPKKRTDRHLSGHIYVAVGSLEPKLMEVTVAKLPFPLKRFFLKLRFTQHQGHPVVSRGYVDLEIKVPLFVHKRIISRFQASSHRLIPK